MIKLKIETDFDYSDNLELLEAIKNLKRDKKAYYTETKQIESYHEKILNDFADRLKEETDKYIELRDKRSKKENSIVIILIGTLISLILFSIQSGVTITLWQLALASILGTLFSIVLNMVKPDN